MRCEHENTRDNGFLCRNNAQVCLPLPTLFFLLTPRSACSTLDLTTHATFDLSASAPTPPLPLMYMDTDMDMGGGQPSGAAVRSQTQPWCPPPCDRQRGIWRSYARLCGTARSCPPKTTCGSLSAPRVSSPHLPSSYVERVCNAAARVSRSSRPRLGRSCPLQTATYVRCIARWPHAADSRRPAL